MWNRASVLVLALTLSTVSPARCAEPPSLREKFAGQFVVGVGLDGRPGTEYREAERALVLRHFGAVTPANGMKMHVIQRNEGRFDFNTGDALVAFAAANRLQVCGHCLVWARDDNTPPWFFRDGDKPADKDLVLDRLRTHIRTVASHYRGKVASWDVVNEAVDDGKADLRPSNFEKLLGESFLDEAFRAAREADPNALLIYNDYGIEKPAKREKLLKLLRGMIARGVPVQAVGIQGHWEIDAVPVADVEATIGAVRALGLQVMITELDLDLIPRGRWWVEGGKHRDEIRKLDPYRDGAPPELLEKQAEQYRALFQALERHKGEVARVTFWDLHDGRSWLNGFPWRRVNHPLLFDREAKPKSAFWAVVGESPAKP